MRIFVTGASGWIGSATVAELVANGHEVVGLARSEASAEKVVAAGATPLRGDITDLDVLRTGAEEADGVVHLAFRHDRVHAGDFQAAIDTDRAAIDLYGDVLAGSDRPLAIASGVAGAQPGVLSTEADPVAAGPGARQRIAIEQRALALSERGVRAMSVRFAPTVHGTGDHGFIAMLVAGCREHGHAAYVDGGSWPAVHLGDAARLIRLGVEAAPAGTVLHAVAEEGVAVKDIATAVHEGLDLPLEAISDAQAAEEFGFIGQYMGLPLTVSSALTRGLLGWEPTGPTLLDDLRSGAYFTER